MNYIRVTIIKSKYLFSKNAFSFFPVRFQKVEGNLSEAEKQPIVDHTNQEGSFIISREDLATSLESHGFLLGPKTFAGILGEKIAILSALLVAPKPTVLNPRPVDITVGGKDIPDAKSALHPSESWSVHSGGDFFVGADDLTRSAYWSDVKATTRIIHIGVSSTQESSESGEVVNYTESKNYTLSGTKKAIAAAEKAKWPEGQESGYKIQHSQLGEDIVVQSSKTLVVISAEDFDKFDETKLPGLKNYDRFEGYLPEDSQCREVMLEVATK